MASMVSVQYAQLKKKLQKQLVANGHLCQRCRAALGVPITWGYQVLASFELSYSEILATAERPDCRLCLMFGSGLMPTDLELLQNVAGAGHEEEKATMVYRFDGFYLPDTSQGVGGDLRIEVTVPSEYISAIDVGFKIVTYGKSCLPAEKNPESLYSLPESSIEDIRRRREDCLRNHQLCNAGSSIDAKPPSRLIKIEKGASRASLYQTVESDQDIEYMTLSHCWGAQGLEFKLLKENLEQMRAGFEVRELPKTFQQAIKTTWDLGLSHIWIDALCIMQNDDDDWAREAALMEHVYSRSSLNLAASTAANSKHGLFKERQQYTTTCTARLQANGRSPKYTLIPAADWDADKLSLPLMKRAWVLQEMLLSPRILHFCSNHLFWECAEQKPASISYTAYQTQTGPSLPASHNDSPKQQFAKVGHPNTESAHPAQVWREIVLQYSLGGLTYEPDKLVAISAIASRMQAQISGRYLAGLWESQLLDDLLWKYTDLQQPEESGNDSYSYIAPSWSWASVPLAITYTPSPYATKPDHRYLAQLAAAHVKLAHESQPYGQVLDGHITLVGSLANVALACPVPNPCNQYSLNLDAFLACASEDELAAYSVQFEQGSDFPPGSVVGSDSVSRGDDDDDDVGDVGAGDDDAVSEYDEAERRLLLFENIHDQIGNYVSVHIERLLGLEYNNNKNTDTNNNNNKPCQNHDADSNPHANSEEPSQLYLLPIRSTTTTTEYTDTDMDIEALILRRRQCTRQLPSTPPAYERVGVLHIQNNRLPRGALWRAVMNFMDAFLRWGCSQFDTSHLAREMSRRGDGGVGDGDGEFGMLYEVVVF